MPPSTTTTTVDADDGTDRSVKAPSPEVEVTAADDPEVLAEYLAAVRTGCGLQRSPGRRCTRSRVQASAVLFDDAADARERLDPPPEARRHGEETFDINRLMANRLRDFFRVIATGTDEEVDQADAEFMEKLAVDFEWTAEVGTEQSRLAMSVLVTRPDIPEKAYLVELLPMELEQGIQLMEWAMSAVSLLGADPDAAIGEMGELADDFETMTEEIHSIDPPASLRKYHRHHVEHLMAFARVLRQLKPSMAASEIPNSFVTGMETVETEEQILDIGRCRIIADVLHRIASA